MCKLLYWVYFGIVETHIYHSCQHLCQHWYSIYWSLNHCIIKSCYSIWYHLIGRLHWPIAVSQDLKYILFSKYLLRVHKSNIKFDASEKLYWKDRIFLFQQQNKGRYIWHSMSASQYKSGENTEIYVHIVASWLQFIYILWIFYVIILSICHKFIDSSISGRLIPCNFFYCLQGNIHKGVNPGGNDSNWINP